MSDYIKREDVLKYPIRLNHYDKENGSKDFVLGCESVIEYVENLPAADVRENKHGYWEVVCSDPWTVLKCSECGYERCTDMVPNFCEKCGAVITSPITDVFGAFMAHDAWQIMREERDR